MPVSPPSRMPGKQGSIGLDGIIFQSQFPQETALLLVGERTSWYSELTGVLAGVDEEVMKTITGSL